MKILFVDDEKMVLNGLKRALYQTGWKISIEDSPQKALDCIDTIYPDVVITDVMMPVMNGVEFLEKVSDGWPRISRFVLSGQANEKLILQGSQVSHCWFTKPCSHGLLTQHLSAVEEVISVFPDDKQCQQMVNGSPLFSAFTLLKQYMQCVNSNLCELTVIERPAIDAGMTQLVTHVAERFFPDVQHMSIDEPGFKTALGESQFYALLFITEIRKRVPELFERAEVVEKLGHALMQCKEHTTPLNALVNIILSLEKALVGSVNVPGKVSSKQALLYMLHMWNLPYPIIHTVSEKAS